MTDEEMETFLCTRPVMRKMPLDFQNWYREQPNLAYQLGLEKHREISAALRDGPRVNRKPLPYRSHHPEVAADRDTFEAWKAANPELASAWKRYAHRAYVCRMGYERMRKHDPDYLAEIVARELRVPEMAAVYSFGSDIPVICSAEPRSEIMSKSDIEKYDLRKTSTKEMRALRKRPKTEAERFLAQ